MRQQKSHHCNRKPAATAKLEPSDSEPSATAKLERAMLATTHGPTNAGNKCGLHTTQCGSSMLATTHGPIVYKCGLHTTQCWQQHTVLQMSARMTRHELIQLLCRKGWPLQDNLKNNASTQKGQACQQSPVALYIPVLPTMSPVRFIHPALVNGPFALYIQIRHVAEPFALYIPRR